MGSMTGKQKLIEDVFSRLCSLYQSGELRASADMVGFLSDVCDEIEILRELLGDAVDLAGSGCMPHDERLDSWKAALGG